MRFKIKIHTGGKMQSGATKIFTVFTVALLVGVVVFGVVSYYGKERLDPSVKQAIEYANCEQAADQELCRFLAVWQLGQDYTLNATENKNDKSTNYHLNSSGDDFHLTIDGEQPRETTAINGAIFALLGDEWHKQQLPEDGDKNAYRESNQFSFLNLDNSESFTQSGEEKCLQADCLRYEINGQQYDTTVWFDKSNYRLQRVLIRGGNGYSYNANLDYNQSFEISPPENARQVAAGQYILPGGSQVSSAQTDTPSASDLPATGDSNNPEEYKQWMKQRQ